MTTTAVGGSGTRSVDISAEISDTNPERLTVQIVIPSNIITQELISLISAA